MALQTHSPQDPDNTSHSSAGIGDISLPVTTKSYFRYSVTMSPSVLQWCELEEIIFQFALGVSAGDTGFSLR